MSTSTLQLSSTVLRRGIKLLKKATDEQFDPSQPLHWRTKNGPEFLFLSSGMPYTCRFHRTTEEIIALQPVGDMVGWVGLALSTPKRPPLVGFTYEGESVYDRVLRELQTSAYGHNYYTVSWVRSSPCPLFFPELWPKPFQEGNPREAAIRLLTLLQAQDLMLEMTVKDAKAKNNQHEIHKTYSWRLHGS